MSTLSKAMGAAAASLALATAYAANDCTIDYKPGANSTVTKHLNAGDDHVFSPPVDQVQWIKNKQSHDVEVQITNLTPVGPNPKWVKLDDSGDQDPPMGSYVGGIVKLFRAKCAPLMESGATISQGAGLNLATASSTGIYEVANTKLPGGKNYQTLALVQQGKVKEVHTRTGSGTWVAKKSGASLKTLSASIFGQMIAIAGINVDIATLSEQKRTQFLGLMGETPASESSELVPAKGGMCPSGYIKITVNNQLMCKTAFFPHSRWTTSLAAVLNFVVPAAEAREWRLLYVTFNSSSVFDSVRVEWDRDSNVLAFQGGGVSAAWESAE